MADEPRRLCPFCDLPPDRIWLETPSTLAFLDAYPVTEGHTLVTPKRHVGSVFDLPPTELQELWTQVSKVRALLVEKFHPEAFNIGVNDGAAAGQTIPHAHIHIIPRHDGDSPDPRGGIRWVIPTKAKYW
jgi:diadenosine tetraphosphate (Ap4A) HIT family hydrolase